MTQPPPADWSTRLALSVAKEVRRHRKAAGLSAQQLADRCSQVGMPIKRSVLANLESGRRTTVSISEVLVLAAALEVPPALLLFPVGYESALEVLPERQMEPLQAVDWFSAIRAELPGVSSDRAIPSNAIQIFRRHRALGNKLQRLYMERETARAEYLVGDTEAFAQQLNDVRKKIESLRSRLPEHRNSMEEVLAVTSETSSEIDNLRQHVARLKEVEGDLADRVLQHKYVETLFRRVEIELIHIVEEMRRVRSEIREAGLLLPPLSDDLREIIEKTPKLSVDDLEEDIALD